MKRFVAAILLMVMGCAYGSNVRVTPLLGQDAGRVERDQEYCEQSARAWALAQIEGQGAAAIFAGLLGAAAGAGLGVGLGLGTGATIAGAGVGAGAGTGSLTLRSGAIDYYIVCMERFGYVAHDPGLLWRY